MATTVRTDRPTVALLLSVDRIYRRRAKGNALRRIAPKRFNPTHEAWLPILHLTRDGWQVTALFSNTGRAHRLGRDHDWVVLYYRGDEGNGQATIVTEYMGPLRGKRVVRGREAECMEHYGVAAWATPHDHTDGDGVI